MQLAEGAECRLKSSCEAALNPNSTGKVSLGSYGSSENGGTSSSATITRWAPVGEGDPQRLCCRSSMLTDLARWCWQSLVHNVRQLLPCREPEPGLPGPASAAGRAPCPRVSSNAMAAVAEKKTGNQHFSAPQGTKSLSITTIPVHVLFQRAVLWHQDMGQGDIKNVTGAQLSQLTKGSRRQRMCCGSNSAGRRRAGDRGHKAGARAPRDLEQSRELLRLRAPRGTQNYPTHGTISIYIALWKDILKVHKIPREHT